MDWQAAVVGIIIIFALLYTVKLVWGKVKSFSSKSACRADCGCEAKTNRKFSDSRKRTKFFGI